MKANRTRDRLILLTSAVRIIFADENFRTLLKAEGVGTIPAELAEGSPIMKHAVAESRSAFRTNILTLPLTSIVPRKMDASELVRSTIFKQILASLREIGLIEPLVVYPREDNAFFFWMGISDSKLSRYWAKKK